MRIDIQRGQLRLSRNQDVTVFEGPVLQYVVIFHRYETATIQMPVYLQEETVT